MSDKPSVTEPQTQYLVVYLTGVVVVGVHEAITRYLEDDESLQAILLITPDGATTPVDITQNHPASALDGSEFEIIGGPDEACLEYVHYTAPGREEFDTHQLDEDLSLFQPAG